MIVLTSLVGRLLRANAGIMPSYWPSSLFEGSRSFFRAEDKGKGVHPERVKKGRGMNN